MKSFLKLILLLCFLGLIPEQKTSIITIAEKCQLEKSEFLVYENSRIYHLMNFHRIEYSDLEKNEVFSVELRINGKKTQALLVAK